MLETSPAALLFNILTRNLSHTQFEKQVVTSFETEQPKTDSMVFGFCDPAEGFAQDEDIDLHPSRTNHGDTTRLMVTISTFWRFPKLPDNLTDTIQTLSPDKRGIRDSAGKLQISLRGE